MQMIFPKYSIRICSSPLYSGNVLINLSLAPRPVQPRGSRSRAIHLIHNLFSWEQSHAAAQLASLQRKVYPDVKDVSLRLFEDNDTKKDPSTMTLSEALKSLKPCSYLKELEIGTETKPGGYCISSFPDPQANKPLKKRMNLPPMYYKNAGRSKEIHLRTTNDGQLLRHYLILAYNFLLEGSRVEFHLHQRTSQGVGTVDWALAHCMSLRPDSILAAMPEGTSMLALPVTTNLSFKTRMPRNAHLKTSTVMWAMENGEALKRHSAITPKKIKQWLGLDRHASPQDTPRDSTRETKTSMDNSPLTLDSDPETPSDVTAQIPNYRTPAAESRVVRWQPYKPNYSSQRPIHNRTRKRSEHEPYHAQWPT